MLHWSSEEGTEICITSLLPTKTANPSEGRDKASLVYSRTRTKGSDQKEQECTAPCSHIDK